MRALRVRIAGAEWRIAWSPRMRAYGEIELGSSRVSRVIRLRTKQSDHELLDTLIHEVLHAEEPHLEEAEVTRRASDLAAILLRIFSVSRR